MAGMENRSEGPETAIGVLLKNSQEEVWTAALRQWKERYRRNNKAYYFWSVSARIW